MKHSTPPSSDKTKAVESKYICPNCKGNPIVDEMPHGFTVCGLCKGERTVLGIDESYHEERTSFLGWMFGNRDWTDVVRIRAKERPVTKKMKQDLESLAKYHNTRFLGFIPYYTALIQNDINHAK